MQGWSARFVGKTKNVPADWPALWISPPGHCARWPVNPWSRYSGFQRNLLSWHFCSKFRHSKQNLKLWWNTPDLNLAAHGLYLLWAIWVNQTFNRLCWVQGRGSQLGVPRYTWVICITVWRTWLKVQFVISFSIESLVKHRYIGLVAGPSSSSSTHHLSNCSITERNKYMLHHLVSAHLMSPFNWTTDQRIKRINPK